LDGRAAGDGRHSGDPLCSEPSTAFPPAEKQRLRECILAAGIGLMVRSRQVMASMALFADATIVGETGG
jgi:hypothetical protein